MDVRFVAHCGLKSDIVGGPKSARSRHRRNAPFQGVLDSGERQASAV
jgi:hypothetical protein